MFLRNLPQRLLADSKLADNIAISVCIALLEVVKQTPTLAYKHEKTTPGTVILLMCFEVFRQLADTLAQDGDLNLWASSVRVVGPELLDDVCLSYRCQHSYSILLISISLLVF